MAKLGETKCKEIGCYKCPLWGLPCYLSTSYNIQDVFNDIVSKDTKHFLTPDTIANIQKELDKER